MEPIDDEPIATSATAFGHHVRQLRRARGLTQEILALRSSLSADTIRRLERGTFSPSLDTLIKLCNGLDLLLSTFFSAFELSENETTRELADFLETRSRGERLLAMKVLRVMFAEMDDLHEDEDRTADEEPIDESIVDDDGIQEPID